VRVEDAGVVTEGAVERRRLGAEENDGVDVGERREMARAAVVRHQHVGECVQHEQLAERRGAGKGKGARRTDRPRQRVSRVTLGRCATERDESVRRLLEHALRYLYEPLLWPLAQRQHVAGVGV